MMVSHIDLKNFWEEIARSNKKIAHTPLQKGKGYSRFIIPGRTAEAELSDASYPMLCIPYWPSGQLVHQSATMDTKAITIQLKDLHGTADMVDAMNKVDGLNTILHEIVLHLRWLKYDDTASVRPWLALLNYLDLDSINYRQMSANELPPNVVGLEFTLNFKQQVNLLEISSNWR